MFLLCIFALNIFDALFTMMWIARGGGEANPVMDWMLRQGDYVFLLQKCLVVGVWLVFLLVHKNFKMARFGLLALACIYGLLVIYHVTLITSGADPRRGEPADGTEDRGRMAPAAYEPASVRIPLVLSGGEEPGGEAGHRRFHAQDARPEQQRPAAGP